MKLDKFVFGKKVIIHLIENYPHLLKKVFLLKNSPFLKLVGQKTPFQIWTSNHFTKFFPNANHQFIAGLIQYSFYYPWKKFLLELKSSRQKNGLILVLDHIQDPQNFGAVLRTAAATKVAAIIVPNFNQAPINALTIKAATGSIFGLKIIQVANLVQTVTKLKEHYFWIFSSASTGEKLYNQAKFSDLNVVLVVGNEHHGVSNLLQKHSDFLLKIPMYKVESLNVSNATAVLLYQIREKQNFWKLN